MYVHSSSYINLSEQLRSELELKIDTLYLQNRFMYYADTDISLFKSEIKSDHLRAYIIGKPQDNYATSGKLLQGVKTWSNMYYDDRHSVISKFKIYYNRVISQKNLFTKNNISVVFCKFLINELLEILAESKWQPLINRIDAKL